MLCALCAIIWPRRQRATCPRHRDPLSKSAKKRIALSRDLDRLTGKGMTTVVGRIRRDPLLSLKFVVLSHNTIRGAAGGSIYNAELLVKENLL